MIIWSTVQAIGSNVNNIVNNTAKLKYLTAAACPEVLNFPFSIQYYYVVMFSLHVLPVFVRDPTKSSFWQDSTIENVLPVCLLIHHSTFLTFVSSNKAWVGTDAQMSA